MRGAILSLMIITGLGFSIPASAQSEPVKLTDRQVKRLSGKLCRTLSDFSLEEQDLTVGQKIEEHLLNTSGVDEKSLNYRLQLADFWNANSDRIICRANGETTYPEQHFFHRVVRHRYTGRLLKRYFFNDVNNFPIDPNVLAINQYDCDETLLDYMDRILSLPNADENYNTYQIREVRDIIVNDFGGKRARELP